MTRIHPLLNNTCNYIHSLAEPEHHPLTRMFATRLAETACAVIEAALIVFKTVELGTLCVKSSFLAKNISEKASELQTHIIGFASTLFFGVVFSPETNFKIHVKLGLATNDLAKKSERELAAKLQAEEQNAELEKTRNTLFAKLENQSPQTETDLDLVNSQLVELMRIKV